MMVRIPWDRYEVALLFDTYERVAGGSDINAEAAALSASLRNLAVRRGLTIDNIYRNVNGMRMHLDNVQYLFTHGKKGLSSPPRVVRQMYELYKTDYAEYQMILKEAIRLTGSNVSIEDAFFAYAKERMRLSPDMITDYLQKATAFCHLKQPLLGMTDVKAVRNVQQKVAEGKLLRFRYGKDAHTIRTVTQLYYNFIKSYRVPQEKPPMQKTSAVEKTKTALTIGSDRCTTDTEDNFENQDAISIEVSEESMSESNDAVPSKDTTEKPTDCLWVEFDKDSSYLFTKPVSYTYRGILHNAKSWNRLYVEVCSLLFIDHHEAFMNIMNGDVPGRSALAFADEQNYHRMRAPKSFAPGYYLESNMDATSIVRKISGLYRLFELGDNLRISYARRNEKIAFPNLEETNEEWIIHELRAKRIPYVDNRSVEGCLWIASDSSIPIVLKEAENRGYRLHFKPDGCRAFPNRPVIWTKDQPQQPNPAALSVRSGNLPDLDDFGTFLVQKQHLAGRTAGSYRASIRMIEEYIWRNELPYSLINSPSSDVHNTVNALMERPDFVKMNDVRHHQFSAAMAQYVIYLEKINPMHKSVSEQKQETFSDLFKDNVVAMDENGSLSPEMRERILSVVTECFPHGIRPASIIDMNKLKRAYQSKLGEELPADIDVVSLLTNSGLQSGEKVYFLSDKQKQSLRSLIAEVIGNGHRVIYYSELFALHGALFEACHIYESPLMQTVLQSILPEHIYKAEYMVADQGANEIEEITEAFGDDVIRTYQQLKRQCPYLTMSAIKLALTRSDSFVWSSPETYARTDRIELDQAEVSDTVDRILPLIREKGYFSLAQLPIEESCGMNPQVSASAVRDAIYNRYMSDEFTRNGLIVKRPGLRLTTYQLLEDWLKGLDRVTLTEVEAYECELTGHHALLGIVAAGNTMVRIDHDHYVSDADIQFNVDAIDHAISLFAGNRIIPITAITSYTSFPDVPGYNWNLYLVESFLRRFSKRFTIDGGPAQISYVGGIASADRQFAGYEDRLAHAVLQDGITLTEEAIGHYLTSRKYILRRSELVRKTLNRARILNEQRGDSSVRI